MLYTFEKIKELFFLESKQIVNSAGGYFNKNGESAFPQADGTTASTWGLWRGGQWWSRGYGWRIYDCRNTEIKNFHVTGFTGGAIAAGLHGSPAGEDGQDHRLIKRVVGVEGDVIQIKEGHLYRNNEEVRDNFEEMKNAGIAKDPIIVKSGELFVLGDNRNNSYDSRKIGLVKIKDVTNIVKGNLFAFWKDKK